MAQYTKAVSIAFNDNDGGLTWIANPKSADDIQRHYQMFGKWRARIMFFKAFWKALKQLEYIAGIRASEEQKVQKF